MTFMLIGFVVVALTYLAIPLILKFIVKLRTTRLIRILIIVGNAFLGSLFLMTLSGSIQGYELTNYAVFWSVVGYIILSKDFKGLKKQNE